jgi:TPR repeat protein
MNEMADEWVCPITTELPLEPVTAEDGHIYERSAIEELIRVKGASLKSPLTNEKMGSRLMPCTQARNTIEKLMRSGAISGDKAERWLERLSDEELVKATRAKAEGGDKDAIHDLANWYCHGEHGLAEDLHAMVRFCEQGAKLDHPPCIALLGEAYFYGVGIEENQVYGSHLLTQAAMMGSAYACSYLGEWHYDGEHGVPTDKARARYWYRKVASCEFKGDLVAEEVDEAATRAQEADE